MKNAEERYLELKEKYQSMIEKQTQTINLISNIRLIVFLVCAGLGIYIYVRKDYGLFVYELAFLLALFFFLVLLYQYFMNKRKYSIAFHEINENSLKRIHGEWTAFTDGGEEFIDENHSYSQDLDIFGKGSLFQFINTTVTYLGRIKFKDLLILPAKNIAEIRLRQEAVMELSQKLDWRQRYMAEGLVEHEQMRNPEFLFSWANGITKFYRNRMAVFVFRLMPIITVIIGVLTFLNPELKYYGLISALILQFGILRINSKKRTKVLVMAYDYMKNIKVYDRMLTATPNI